MDGGGLVPHTIPSRFPKSWQKQEKQEKPFLYFLHFLPCRIWGAGLEGGFPRLPPHSPLHSTPTLPRVRASCKTPRQAGCRGTGKAGTSAQDARRACAWFGTGRKALRAYGEARAGAGFHG